MDPRTAVITTVIGTTRACIGIASAAIAIAKFADNLKANYDGASETLNQLRDNAETFYYVILNIYQSIDGMDGYTEAQFASVLRQSTIVLQNIQIELQDIDQICSRRSQKRSISQKTAQSRSYNIDIAQQCSMINALCATTRLREE